MTKPTPKTNPGMKFVIIYAVLFVINALILGFANMLYAKQVVLGTHSLSPLWAILLSMGTLALIDTFAIPFVRAIENSRNKMFSSSEWMILYAILNFAGLWVISHYSQQFGLGISIWYISLILALIMDVLQGIAMMALQKRFE